MYLLFSWLWVHVEDVTSDLSSLNLLWTSNNGKGVWTTKACELYHLEHGHL